MRNRVSIEVGSPKKGLLLILLDGNSGVKLKRPHRSAIAIDQTINIPHFDICYKELFMGL